MLFNEPSDGFTGLEKLILQEVVCRMYRKVKDPVDKFILIAKFESGYKQGEIAKMLGLTPMTISNRLSKVRTFLKEARKNKEL